MRKWLMRLSTISIVIVLLNSHHGLIDSVSNFMIDGVVPLTNWALGSVLSVVAIILGVYFIYKSVVNLRFEMLKRSAILYNQQRQAKLAINNTAQANKQVVASADELELVQNSL